MTYRLPKREADLMADMAATVAERDTAIRERDEARQALAVCDACCRGRQAEVDEARADLAHCRQALSSLNVDFNRIASERDEAKAVALRIWDSEPVRRLILLRLPETYDALCVLAMEVRAEEAQKSEEEGGAPTDNL